MIDLFNILMFSLLDLVSQEDYYLHIILPYNTLLVRGGSERYFLSGHPDSMDTEAMP